MATKLIVEKLIGLWRVGMITTEEFGTEILLAEWEESAARAGRGRLGARAGTGEPMNIQFPESGIASLSVVASRISRTMNDTFEMMPLDAGFDGGEFSGPAHMNALFRDVAKILTECGWTALDFDNELIARTSPKWVERTGLIQFTVDEEQDWRGR